MTPPRRPFPQGARAALGAPAVAMGATFLAFGAAVAEAGLGLGWALGASWGVYGMAGQLVLLQGAGGAALPAALGATAANARFLPMAVALAPLLGRRRWPALPFIAITPWAAAMRALPALPEAARLPWFMGFALASFLAAGAATAAGFALAPFLPRAVLAGLLFANPLYFALLLAGDLGRPGVRAAVLAGLAAAPLVPILPGAWGLPLAGVLAGTAAFLWEKQ